MKAIELREKSPEDLNKTLLTLREEQFKLRMQKSTGQLGQTHLLKQNQRDIARVKTVLNELIAYLQLADMNEATLSDRSRLILTYALCGFANFSSIAIQLGGIGGLAPNRRSDIARLGLRAVLGGTLATMMTATIAGVLTQLAG